MGSVLAKLALPRLEARVAVLSRDLDRADPGADPARYSALVHEIAAHHARRRALLARTRRGGGA